MSDWQPIETAPKDGTQILAFGNGLKKDRGWEIPRDFEPVFAIIWWNEWEQEKLTAVGDNLFAKEQSVVGRWSCKDTFFQPIRWMPLPEPPNPVPDRRRSFEE